jgi:hypothetical protein
MTMNASTLRGRVPLSSHAYVAAFGEVEYREAGNACRFTTQVRIEPPSSDL